MSNMFEAAKKVEKKTKKPAAKKGKATVEIKGLRLLAAIKTVMKSLEATADTLDGELKEKTAEYFTVEGAKTGTKPANFPGIEENAEANCQLRKRTSRSVLTDAEVELLKEHGVPFDTSEDITTTYIINPEYKDDEKLLGRVSDALAGVEGMPKNFLQYQEGTPARTVTDESVAAAFATKDEDTIRQLLTVVGTLANRIKFNGDLEEAMDVAKEVLAE